MAEFGVLLSKSLNEERNGSDWMRRSRDSWDSKFNLSFLPVHQTASIKSDRESKRSSIRSTDSRVLAILASPSKKSIELPATGDKPTLPPLSAVLSEIGKSDAWNLDSPIISLNNLSLSSSEDTLVDSSKSQDRNSLPSISQLLLDSPKVSNAVLPPIQSEKRSNPFGPLPTLIMPKSDNVVDTWTQVIDNDDDDEGLQGHEIEDNADWEDDEGPCELNLVFRGMIVSANDDAFTAPDCDCTECRALDGALSEWAEEVDGEVVVRQSPPFESGPLLMDGNESDKENVPPAGSVNKTFVAQPRRISAGVLQQLIEKVHPSSSPSPTDSVFPLASHVSKNYNNGVSNVDGNVNADNEGKVSNETILFERFPQSVFLDLVMERMERGVSHSFDVAVWQAFAHPKLSSQEAEAENLHIPMASPPRRKRVDSKLAIPNLFRVGRKVSKIFKPSQW